MRLADLLARCSVPARRPSASDAYSVSRTRARWAYWLASALWTSGLLWLGGEHFVRIESEFGPVHHPLQAWLLKAHGVLAMIAIWGFGVLWTIHVRRFWMQCRNRTSGAAMFALMTLLILTGTALYYASDEHLRAWTSLLHWILGLGAGFALIVHVALGRRRRQ